MTAPADAVHLPTLSTSGAKAYRRCPRAYAFTYELRRVSARCDPNLAFGTLGHRGLEAWWLARQAGEDALTAAVVSVASEPDAFDRAKAEALMVGYHDAWNDVEMDVLAVEREFVAPLVNPATGAESKTWLFTGKIDAIARINGRVYVVEHKTTSEDVGRGSTYWERLTLDAQIGNYLVGARLLGYEPEGAWYDVIKKPALRPLKATPPEERKFTKAGTLYANQRAADESPDEYHERLLVEIESKRGTPEAYFHRGEIVRLPNEEREAMANLWATAKQIRESQRSGLWPQNPDACFKFNRPCEYLPVCAGRADINDSALYQPKEEAKKAP